MNQTGYHEPDAPSPGPFFSCKMSLKGRSGFLELIIIMDDSETTSLEQIGAFLAGSGGVEQSGTWCVTIRRPGPARQGLIRRYLAQMTDLSRAQVTRLIGIYQKRGRVRATVYQRRTCTGCATRKLIGNATPANSRPGPPPFPSASGANHSRTARPGSYALPCIKATRMGGPVSPQRR